MNRKLPIEWTPLVPAMPQIGLRFLSFFAEPGSAAEIDARLVAEPAPLDAGMGDLCFRVEG
jgi:hypothetical protein